MTKSLFLDTAYAVALTSPQDILHSRAQELADEIEKSGTWLVTTRAVMLEIGNALCGQRYRHVSVRLLELLEMDRTVEIVPLSEELYAEAFQLYRTRPDKDWSLVDCASFVVMQQRGIYEALTSDHHFEQAGFIRLLK